MSLQEQYQQALQLFQQRKLEQALSLFKSIEPQMAQLGDQAGGFYLQYGQCAFNAKEYKLCYEALEHINTSTFNAQYLNLVVTLILLSLIFDHQFQKCMKTTQTYLIQFKDNQAVLEQVYFNRGYCLQEQGMYNVAINEYKLSFECGNKQFTNIAYCFARMKKYQEGKEYIDKMAEDPTYKNELQTLLTKSEIYSNINQEKVGIECLYTAHQYYIAGSFEEAMYSPEEAEFLKSKLGPQNAEKIQQLYDFAMNNEQCTAEQTNVIKQFTNEMNNKKQLGLSPDLLAQIELIIPKSVMKVFNAEKELETLFESDPILKDYYSSFLKEAEGTFFSAQGIQQGFTKVKGNSLVSIGAELLKMIPLVGATASSLLTSLYDKIVDLEMDARSKALLQVGNTNNEFIDKLKQQLCLALKEDKLQQKIKNPKQTEGFMKYVETIKQIKAEIQKNLEVQAFGVLVAEETPQMEMGQKDAQELIGAYYSSGYLQTLISEQEKNQQCAQYIIMNDEEREAANKQVKNRLKLALASKTEQTQQSSCCIVQ